MKKNSNYKIICNGSNLNNFINICKNENLEIYNIEKNEINKMTFEISEKNFIKLKKVDIKNYSLEVYEKGGVVGFKNLFLRRVGVLVGLLLSIVLIFLTNNRLVNIQINGLSSVSKNDICDTLSENNVKLMSKTNFNTSNIENILTETYNFSLVSAITKGNTLIINIKEELDEIQDEFIDIVSDYNMVIKDIEVYSGTANVNVGDIVYAGDVLVYSYIIQNDQTVGIKPSAKIEAEVFYVDNYNFKNQEKKLERTGNKKICFENISMGKFFISNRSNEIDFEKYEIEEKTNLVSKYFLPITITQKVAYELSEVQITHNFDDEKNGIINSLKSSVYAMKDERTSVIDEDEIITQIDGGYLVSYYLKCSLQLKYN